MNILSTENLKRSAGVFIALLIIAFIVGLYIYNTRSYPKFKYDPTGINGWWSSENINLQSVASRAGNNYRGSEPINNLPVADLTVHHGEKGSEDTPEDECFVGFSYFDYQLGNLRAAYLEYEDRKRERGELTILGKSQQSINTFEGDKAYELRQYDLAIEDEEDILSGYQVGFAKLESGYIRVESVCRTADDLQLTEPIITSVKLNV